MTDVSGLCDICGYQPIWPEIEDGDLHEGLIVCALPAFPITLAQCPDCFGRCAFPLFCLETLVCDEPLTLEETIERYGVTAVLRVCADWFRNSLIWVGPGRIDGDGPVMGPGRYVMVADFIRRLGQ